MLNPVLTQCAMSLPQQGVLLLTLLIGGLVGSLTHCVGMCSPFVLAMQQAEIKKPPTKLSSLLLPYHAGRIASYIFLGMIAAALSAQIASFSNFKNISAVLLISAASLFLASSFPNLLPKKCGVPQALWARLPQLFQSNKFWVGALLGFIPCGLVYAAILAVASTQSPILAAAGMAVFGLGTIPALAAVGCGFYHLRHIKFLQAQMFSRGLCLVNAFLLFLMAGGLLI